MLMDTEIASDGSDATNIWTKVSDTEFTNTFSVEGQGLDGQVVD
jgi:hypothetical protein